MIRDLTRLIAVATFGAALIQAASRPPIEVRLSAAPMSVVVRV